MHELLTIAIKYRAILWLHNFCFVEQSSGSSWLVRGIHAWFPLYKNCCWWKLWFHLRVDYRCLISERHLCVLFRCVLPYVCFIYYFYVSYWTTFFMLVLWIAKCIWRICVCCNTWLHAFRAFVFLIWSCHAEKWLTTVLSTDFFVKECCLNNRWPR